MLDYLKSLGENLSIDIIIAMLSFITGLFVEKLKAKLKIGRLSKSLKIKINNTTILCFTANPQTNFQEPQIPSEYPLGYVFEYMAVCILKTSFLKADFNVMISPLDFNNIDNIKLKQDLILIGGPFNNSVTKELLFNPKFSLPFEFDNKNNLIYKKFGQSNIKYTPEFSSDGTYCKKDYSLIIVKDNPFDHDKKIIALIGCHSLGCYGAACYIKNQLFKNKAARKDTNYAIIFQCYGNKNETLCIEETDEMFDRKSVEYIKL